jgi:hypothetical protein
MSRRKSANHNMSRQNARLTGYFARVGSYVTRQKLTTQSLWTIDCTDGAMRVSKTNMRAAVRLIQNSV